MTTVRVPAVVVGAGPVGVLAATLLAQRGIETVVLERHRQPYPLPRAVHLDDEVHSILREIGVAEQFTAISRPMPGMRLLDARHRTMAEFRRDPRTGRPGGPQASMFDQPDLERVLLDNLSRHPEAELRRGCTVIGVEPQQDHRVAVCYRDVSGDHRVVADAVLGCDGANSTVRVAIGASMIDLGFCERWLVIDGRTCRPLPVWGGVHQVCDPSRPATFMHVTGTRYRWEFRLDAGEDAETLTTPAVLAGLLEPWLGRSSPEGVEIIRHATYTFRAQVADRWTSGRIFLLGDAAHQSPPFIGQGLGAGLRDAHNLSWKLAGVLSGALTEQALDSYEAERRPHATRTVRAAVTVGWVLTGGHDRAAVLRRSALGLLWRIPGISRVVLSTASPSLGPSALVRRRYTRRGPGRVFPGAGLPPAAPRSFTVVSGRPPTTSEAAAMADLGVDHVVERGRRGAVLVRPDGAVAAVGAGPRATARLLRIVRGVSSGPAGLRRGAPRRPSPDPPTGGHRAGSPVDGRGA